MKDYEGLIMPSVASVKKYLEVLGTTGQEDILNYLEEVIVLGSFATEVTNKVKEIDFPREKFSPTLGMRKYKEMASSMANKDIICKSCRKTFTDFTRSPRYNSKEGY